MSEKRNTSRKLLSMLLGAVCFCFLVPNTGQSQVQVWQNIDSLESVYLQNDYEEALTLMILQQLAQHHKNLDKKIQYSEELIDVASQQDSIERVFDGYIASGHALMTKGRYQEALGDYFNASKIAGDIEQEVKLVIVNLAIAGGYSRLGNYENALDYYKKTLVLLKDETSLNYGYTLFNTGDQYLMLNKPDSALVYFDLADPIFKLHNNMTGQAYSLGDRGMAYAMLGKDDLALQYMEEAVSILTEMEDYYPICQFLLAISEIYLKTDNLDFAEQYAIRSLELGRKHQLNPEIRDANLALSKIYEANGNRDRAFEHYQNYVQLKDSLVNITSVQQLADMRTDFEIAQKQLEVDLLNNQKRTQRIIMYSLGFMVLLIALFYRRISKEKNRSDLLLLNILPSRTARELKEKGKVKARKFEEVTVMFTDFEAFTKYSQDLSPEKLVKSVDYFFSAFDKIIEKHGLEKIKTIGDAYMCTGGLIAKGPLQPVKVIQAAFEIIDFVDQARESDNEDIAHFRIRIGINTGPVVGGVVGTKKFAYDIWGDTVNVAARMETNSKPSSINISENTYQLVKDRFECEYRGEIDVKNKGMMKMYFVKGTKTLINNNKIEQEPGGVVSSAPHRP